ncbi:hypothetical protein EII31_05385 [Leucobacter sp. OH2974_COT-288]|nr:hypothetical protein EII31_05385 [Leucobacter sp. OH2974_COT-288]
MPNYEVVSRKPAFSLTRYLTVFFLKARQFKLSAALAAVASFAVLLIFLLIQTGQLTAQQIIARDLGSFSHRVIVPLTMPLQEAAKLDFAEIEKMIISAGADRAVAAADSYQVYFGTDSKDRATLQSFNWNVDKQLENKTLLEGKFPENADEVVVTRQLAERLGGSEVSFGSSEVTFKIVGLYEEVFNPAPYGLLLHSEGWQKFQTLGANEQYDLQLIVYFDTADTDITVYLEKVRAWLQLAGFETPDVEAFYAGVESKSGLSTYQPTLYSEVILLSLIAPLAAGSISGYLVARFVKRIGATMHALGIRNSAVPAIAAALGMSIFGAMIGVFCAVIVGYALRPLLTALQGVQIGEYHDIAVMGVLLLLVSVLGQVFGIASLIKPNLKLIVAKKYLPNGWQMLPALSILCFLLGGAFLASREINIQVLGPFVYAIAVVLLAPYLLRLFLQVKLQHPMAALARLRLQQRLAGQIKTTLSLAVVLTIGFSTLALSHAVNAAFNNQQVPRVPPGSAQLLVLNEATDGDALADQVAGHIGSSPVRLEMLDINSEYRDGAFYALADTAAVEKFLKITLTAAEKDALRHGAVLRLGHLENPEINFGDAGALPAFTPQQSPERYGIYGAGLLLADTAREQGFATSMLSWFYTDMNPEQEKILAELPVALGFNPGWLIQAAPDFEFAESWQAILIGLGTGIIAGFLVLGYANGAARNLRGTNAALLAIGVPRRWYYRLVATEVGAVVLIAIVSAVLGTIVGMLITAITWARDFEMRLPWLPLGSTVGVLVLVTVIAVITAGRKMQLNEREHSE